MLVVDPQTVSVLAANRQAAEVYGRAQDELVGMRMDELSRDFTAGERHVRKLFAGTPQVRFSSVQQRRDGTDVEFEATAALVQYGGRTAVLNSYRDVTERNRLQRGLESSELRFRSIVEHGYDIVTIIDADGRTLVIGGSVMKALGYTSEELIGTKLVDNIHPQDRPSVAAAIAGISAEHDRRTNVTCRVRNKAGAWRWCEGTGVNMIHVPGVNGIVIIARDVTDQRELETRLEQERRVESLGRIAATVAHEFNNALMAIQPSADILARRYADHPDIVRIAQNLAGGVQRGRRIARQILGFANAGAPVRQRIRLDEWLAQLSAELRPQVGSHITLTTHAGQPSLAVDADPDQLHQVVTNLVVNARDAMPDGGTIAIAAALTAGELPTVEISVRDNGPGIPGELLPRIFEPLFTTKSKGTGLGLAVCQQVVAKHGGTIHVESDGARGTAFFVRLPAPADLGTATPPPTRRRVLLVEDDVDVAHSLRLILQDAGYAVEWSASAQGITHRVAARAHDLVLMDIQLGDGDGREVLRCLRRTGAAVPVILMSGRVLVDEDELDAASAFLPKPFTADELLRLAATLP
jgi:PAS domain S-box-containing protein